MGVKYGIKAWLPLVGIVLSVFIFNMSEFMPIGLLVGIASDLGVSESQAGLIIAVYAWVVAIASVPLMLIFKSMEYRRMLLMSVILFVAFQVMSGLSFNYWMLMASRIGVAISHGVFWSIASALAVRSVPPGKGKTALAAVATGTSLAMILGLPIGRAIGLALGWRMTFIAIAAIAIFALVLLTIVFPRMENPGNFSLKNMPEIFHNKVLMGIYVVLVMFVLGYYTGYSYIEPFLKTESGFSPEAITFALTLIGIAGILASYLFSRLYDRQRFFFILFPLAGVGLALFLLKPLAGSYLGIMLICAFWGFCGTLFVTCYQNEIITAASTDSLTVSMSMFSALFNAGIAGGSMVGGAVFDTLTVANIGYVSCIFEVAAVAVAVLFLVKEIKKREGKKC